jgi:hypothetical protein
VPGAWVCRELAEEGVAGVVGRFDQRPAEVGRAVLGERSAAVVFAGLGDARAEAGVADQLAWAWEASDLANLGGDRVGEHLGDPGHRAQERHVGMLAPSRRSSRSSSAIFTSSASIRARLACTVSRQGSGSSSRASRARPRCVYRPTPGRGCPCAISVWWMQFFSIVRCSPRNCVR